MPPDADRASIGRRAGPPCSVQKEIEMKGYLPRLAGLSLVLGLVAGMAAAPASADDCDPPPEPSGCVSYYGSVENRYIPCLYTDQKEWDKYVAAGGFVDPKKHYPGEIYMGPPQR